MLFSYVVRMAHRVIGKSIARAHCTFEVTILVEQQKQMNRLVNTDHWKIKSAV
jgi:hypothetical protein